MHREPSPEDLARAAAGDPTDALGTTGVVRGTVKYWRDEKGYGAISSDATKPWDIWCHFSAIEAPGYRSLRPGESVEVEYMRRDKDSFRYEAVRVRRDLVIEQSIEVDVSPAFAWKFRTDIATWDDPPATFLLDGPFAEGSSGKTLMPGEEPLVWWIRDVEVGRSFAIELPLDRAVLRFEWYLDAVTERRTKLTHRVVLSGANAQMYREQVEKGFGENLAAGLERLAGSMTAADRAAGHAG